MTLINNNNNKSSVQIGPWKIPHSSLATAQSLIKILIFCLICFAAISSRLFSVIRFESIIHEYDPWFNYRSTQFLVKNGWYKFLNWFDESSWHPLGRVVGGTVFPGIMVTSALIYEFFRRFLLIPIDIRHICVFLAPAFSALTAISTYGLTKEIDGRTSSALLAAFFIAVAPGYSSRSVAGAYDNEAISIFLLVTTFYFWLKALRLGSVFYGSISALFYFYMAAAWGGYVFIINLIPLHVFTLIVMGRYSKRLYCSYSTFYVIGTLASMTIPFIGVNPSRTNDHMAALGTFGFLQIVAIIYTCQNYVSSKDFQKFLVLSIFICCFLACFVFSLLSYFNILGSWTARLYSLYDIDYAKKNIPIVASVSEHQPTAWSSFFFDLQLLLLAFPSGLYFCFKDLNEVYVFVILYSLTSSYFASVMVRLVLTLTPIICVASAICFSRLLEVYLFFPESSESKASISFRRNSRSDESISDSLSDSSSSTTKTATTVVRGDASGSLAESLSSNGTPISIELRILIVSIMGLCLIYFAKHCIWVTSNAYSSPSVVLASHDNKGNQVIIDDYREAYYWLKKNTPSDAKILAWWDYGYQITGFSDRITIVDNNTWNNTHIAVVGKVFASSEKVSYEILNSLAVDYVLVICGAVSGYSGDDINKFLWMVRIAENEFPEDVQSSEFLSSQGHYNVDDRASQKMKDSLMYKLSYYRMDDITGGNPVDNARNSALPKISPKLSLLEEAFSSERYIVRIYKVKKPDVLARNLFQVEKFDKTFRS